MIAGTLFAVLVGLAGAGCGGGSDSQASRSDPFGVCKEFTDWQADVESTLSGLEAEGFSMKRADLLAAATQIADRTHDLALTVHDSQIPGIEEGPGALADLATELEYRSDQMRMTSDAPNDSTGLVVYEKTMRSGFGNAASAIGKLLDGFRALGYRDELLANENCKAFMPEGVLDG